MPQIHTVPSTRILHLLSGSVVRPFLFMMPPLPWSSSQTLLPTSSQWPVCPSPQLQFWSCSSLPYNTIRAQLSSCVSDLKFFSALVVKSKLPAWPGYPSSPLASPSPWALCVYSHSLCLWIFCSLCSEHSSSPLLPPQPPSHHIFRWLHPSHPFRGLRVDTALSRKAPVTTWIHPLHGPPPLEQKPLLGDIELATVCASHPTVSAVRGGIVAACSGDFTPSGVHWSICGTNKIAEVLLGNFLF